MRFGALVLAAYLAVDPLGWDFAGPLRFGLISTIGFASIASLLGSGDSRSRPLPRWSVIGWALLLFGMTISTVLSRDPWHGLVGTPDRHFGLATWILLAGLFAIASLYPNSTTTPVVRATMLGGAGAGAWSITEFYDIGWFASSFAGDRAGGPFSQPAYLGYAMVMAISISVGAVADENSNRGSRTAAAVALGLSVAGLGLSQSRGAWLAATVAVALVIVRRRLWVAGAIVVLALGLAISFTAVGNRIATLADEGGVVAGRVDEWQVGARTAVDTPTFGLTGHGPEGYRIAFGEHVDDQYVVNHGRDVITDRAHNALLDITLAGGFISGIGALLLYGGLAVTAIQRLRANDWIDVGIAAAVLGGLLQQLVLFPLAELDPVLWVLAALLVARRPTRNELRPPLIRQVSGAKRAAMLLSGLLAALAVAGGLSDVAADHAIARAIDVRAEDAATALEHADAARSRRPDSIRYHFIAARIALNAELPDGDGLNQALLRFDDGLRISANDPALRVERAALLLEIARRDQESESLELALTELESLEQNEPSHPRVLNDLGIAQALAGNPDVAVAAWDRAALLNPTNTEPRINAAIVHLEAGDLELGESLLDEVLELAPGNIQALNLRREFLSE